LWNLQIEDRLMRLLAGNPVQFDLRDHTPIWTRRVREALASSAPWLLARSDERSQLVREIWSRAPRGKSSRALRLFGLGVQTQQRRPGVFLVRSSAQVGLKLDWSASNARVPAAAWLRPLDYDLVRLGLIEPRMIPNQ
jgi:hypothetical protein